MKSDKEKVLDYYEKCLPNYDETYKEDDALYPSNRFRFDLALDKLMEVKAHRVLDAGCGNGIILQELLERGFDAEGFDYSPAGVKFAKKRLSAKGFDPKRVRLGDIETMCGYAACSFDAIVVMGALTHKIDEANALESLRTLLRPGGIAIIELRNELFSLYTFNNYTMKLFDKMIPRSSLGSRARQQISGLLGERKPAPRMSVAVAIAEDYFPLPTVWKNPLTIDKEYALHDFNVVDKLWFHWHCVPPLFEELDRKAFKQESILMERYPHDWRGHFMCSAFLLVAEAV